MWQCTLVYDGAVVVMVEAWLIHKIIYFPEIPARGTWHGAWGLPLFPLVRAALLTGTALAAATTPEERNRYSLLIVFNRGLLKENCSFGKAQQLSGAFTSCLHWHPEICLFEKVYSPFLKKKKKRVCHSLYLIYQKHSLVHHSRVIKDFWVACGSVPLTLWHFHTGNFRSMCKCWEFGLSPCD